VLKPVAEITSIGEALAYARSVQLPDGIRPAVLLAHVVGQRREWVLAHPEASLSREQAVRFLDLLARAETGEPLAYLTGQREFFGLTFRVSPEVLIPRPETEELVESVLEWASSRRDYPLRIVDVGAGSGAIGVTLAAKLPNARVIACDVSYAALSITRENAVRHGAAERMQFVNTSLLRGLIGPFDVIVSNPPYVDKAILPELEVSRWEPHIALDGGSYGMEVIRGLVHQVPSRLAPGGLLMMEIGYDQWEPVEALCRALFPQAAISVKRDWMGQDRIVKVGLV
jgi:release factor glutamine methyltransferase